MSNHARRTATKRPPAPRPQPAAPASRNATPWIVGIVIAVIAAIGLAVVLVGGGDDGDDAGGVTTGAPGSGAVQENQPVTVTGAPLAPLEPDQADAALGATVPTVAGASFDGTPITIEPTPGQHTMVVVLAHWCPHCNAEIPRLIELQQDGRLPEDLRIVGVSTAVASDRPNFPPSEWLVDKGWPWEVVADSETLDAYDAYGVTGFPFVTVFDESGTVVDRWSGESDVDVLAARIDAAVAA